MVDTDFGLHIKTMRTHLRDIPDITARRKAMLDELVENGRGRDSSYTSGCAIGRWLEDELCERLEGEVDCRVWKIAHLLPPWLQEMDWRFLAEVQVLHDELPYWDAMSGYKSFNAHGQNRVELIRDLWGLR